MRFLLTTDTHHGYDRTTTTRLKAFGRQMNTVMREHSIDAVLHTGDIASHDVKTQFDPALKLLRDALPNTPIIAVRGNHDFWTLDHPMTYEAILAHHQESFTRYGIHHLDAGPYTIKDTMIIGFDGWYASPFPDTKDYRYIGRTENGTATMQALHEKSIRDIERTLRIDTTEKRVVGMTHFGIFPTSPDYQRMCADAEMIIPFIKKCDVVCMGHSHQRMDEIRHDRRIINAGSGYNTPEYVIFEV